MPATSNNTALMSRRQAFNGKGLTFIEVIFNADIANTASNPDTKDSTFQKTREAISEKGTVLAQSYSLGVKATERDATDVAEITEDELIDTYQFIVEGTPGVFNNADSAGDVNLDPDQADASDPGVIADAETDLEASIIARLSDLDSTGQAHVTMRYLPADGVTSAGAEAVYGTFNARVNA